MRSLPALVLLLTACAPQLILPPIAPSAEWAATGPAPLVPPVPAGAPALRREYDSVTRYTRHSVTTHPGVYTGWVAKPQITFFALTPGAGLPSAMPANIGLIFRALEPQAVLGTTLVLACPTHTDSITVATASHVVPTGNTHSHFLTYMLPTERVAAFSACSEGTLSIAQLRVPFTEVQLGGVRALLVGVGAKISSQPDSLRGRS
jgi:hypothetical protein